MKKRNKLASILLAGSLMFLPVCCHAEADPAEAAAEIEISEAAGRAYEMEKKTTTIYYGNMSYWPTGLPGQNTVSRLTAQRQAIYMDMSTMPLPRALWQSRSTNLPHSSFSSAVLPIQASWYSS